MLGAGHVGCVDASPIEEMGKCRMIAERNAV